MKWIVGNGQSNLQPVVREISRGEKLVNKSAISNCRNQYHPGIEEKS
jgi:hypothetical protein